MASTKGRFIRIAAVILIILLITPILLFLIRNPESITLNDEERKNASGSFIQLSQGITHYEMTGVDTLGTVILVHGFSVPYYIWDSTYYALAKKGFRVVRYDTYGRGFSDRLQGDYTAEVYNKQLDDLIQILKLKTPLHLMGLSFGGPVTSHFTATHPELVKSLTLMDPAISLWNSSTPEFIMYAQTVIFSHKLSEQLSDFYKPENFPGWNEKYLPQMKYKGFIRSLVSTRYHYGVNPIESFKTIAKQGTPVLLIWGKQDPTTSFEGSKIINEILYPVFVPVDEAGHLPHMEKPGVVLPAMLDFSSKHC